MRGDSDSKKTPPIRNSRIGKTIYRQHKGATKADQMPSRWSEKKMPRPILGGGIRLNARPFRGQCEVLLGLLNPPQGREKQNGF